MENREFARILYETADLMEIAGEDGFRIRSYRNGASVIEGYAERIADILANPDRKITDVPGIGKGLAGVLQQIAAQGSFDKRDELLKKFPPAALDFLKIQSQITTATSRIDARLETRLGSILSELLGTERHSAATRGGSDERA